MVACFFCLDSNLLGKFSCGGDDDGLDIGCASSGVLFSFGKFRILSDNVLDGRNEETKSFTSTSSCLSDAARMN